MRMFDDAVEVTWQNGSSMMLPYLWLRDNCPCSECREMQTSEKRFILTSVPVDLQPDNVHLDDDTLCLMWPDGHRTEFDGGYLRSLIAPGQTGWRPWSREFSPLRYDFHAFLHEPDVAVQAIRQFLETGVMILTGASSAPNTLEMLAPRLGPIRELLFDRIHDVRLDPEGYNVAHTAMALPPHNDFASYSWPPSCQALHMLVNDTPGGETIIVDGWAVLEGLRHDHPPLFEQLCNMPVPFREFDENNETCAVAPIVNLHPDGQIARFRFSNQLMQPMDPTQSGVADFYRAYHELARRVSDGAVKVTFRLEAGYILLLAAHRVLHAREAFQPVGNRHLQDAYFEFDNIRNHLVQLTRKGVTPYG